MDYYDIMQYSEPSDDPISLGKKKNAMQALAQPANASQKALVKEPVKNVTKPAALIAGTQPAKNQTEGKQAATQQ